MGDLEEGQKVGPWELLELLGEGGNAEVWRATKGAEPEVAVKFLKTRKVESPRWERFRREVEFIAELGPYDGVLPVIEVSLPEKIPKGERAWYSMPLATPLRDALTTATLREVVEAVIPIARTLARLASEREVAHRDLKPGNLYQWEGSPAIGDFGLIWQPELAALTASDEITGPFTFTAPELFRGDLAPEEIDYTASDVFSLAKTLWALARGSDFALPGEHRPDDDGAPVGLSRAHANATALDQVLARATVSDPARRPTMEDFANELAGWLKLPEPGSADPDLSEITGQIREQLEPTVAAERDRERLVLAGRQALVTARGALRPLFQQLDGVPGAQPDVADEELKGILRSWDDETMQGPDLIMREVVAARMSDLAEPLAYILRFGVLVEAFDTGNLRVNAGFHLAHEKVMGGQTDTHGLVEVELGSVAAEEAVREASQWILDNAEEWATKFAEGR